jgi:DNA-directed RNA polymerase subunit E'/Rpb7
MTENIFIKRQLSHIIKLAPHKLNHNFKDYLYDSLKKSFDGRCSKDGYIKPGSIDIKKIEYAEVEQFSLNGYVNCKVNFEADICELPRGTILKCRVINTNMFGILCAYDLHTAVGLITFIELIIPQQSISMQSSVQLSTVKKGDTVLVEVLGRQFNVSDNKGDNASNRGDNKITGVGRIMDAVEYADRENNTNQNSISGMTGRINKILEIKHTKNEDEDEDDVDNNVLGFAEFDEDDEDDEKDKDDDDEDDDEDDEDDEDEYENKKKSKKRNNEDEVDVVDEVEDEVNNVEDEDEVEIDIITKKRKLNEDGEDDDEVIEDMDDNDEMSGGDDVADSDFDGE